jgi:hypothetical protein
MQIREGTPFQLGLFERSVGSAIWTLYGVIYGASHSESVVGWRVGTWPRHPNNSDKSIRRL